MNIRRTSAIRVGEEIANAGQGNRVSPQVQAASNEIVPVNSPALTDGVVSATLFQIAQDIST